MAKTSASRGLVYKFFPQNFFSTYGLCSELPFLVGILDRDCSSCNFSFFFSSDNNVSIVDTFYRTAKLLDRPSPASGKSSKLVQRVPPFIYSTFNVTSKPGETKGSLILFLQCETFCKFHLRFLLMFCIFL